MTIVTESDIFICFKTESNEIFVKNNDKLNQKIIDLLFFDLSSNKDEENFYKYAFIDNKLILKYKKYTTLKIEKKQFLLCNPLYDIDMSSRKKILIKYF